MQDLNGEHSAVATFVHSKYYLAALGTHTLLSTTVSPTATFYTPQHSVSSSSPLLTGDESILGYCHGKVRLCVVCRDLDLVGEYSDAPLDLVKSTHLETTHHHHQLHLPALPYQHLFLRTSQR